MSQRILTRCLRYTSPHRYCVKLNAPPKFSRSIHHHVARGKGRVENEERNRVGRCENAKGSIRNTVVLLLVEKEEGGRKEGGGTRERVRGPKEYEPYVRRARYKLWAATCMRVITYRDLTVSSQVKHRLVRRVAR